MIKIDLITGFLGSGKTTFLKKYARHCLKKGEHVAVLENDFGAVNVDMMLLQELEQEGCELEMVAGGCDYDCHKRRFKSKLISMGMMGYDRVIVEPSGIYDVDEFFDTIHEDPLDSWYEAGNVFAVVDVQTLFATMDKKTRDTAADSKSLQDSADANSIYGPITSDDEYLLASETAEAGLIVVSHADSIAGQSGRIIQLEPASVCNVLNEALDSIKCPRRITDKEIFIPSSGSLISEFTSDEWNIIDAAGYTLQDYEKRQIIEHNSYDSLYYMNVDMTVAQLKEKARMLLKNKTTGKASGASATDQFGEVLRVKGFIQDSGKWYELNANRDTIEVNEIKTGQSVIIVIGGHLNAAAIDSLIGSTSENIFKYI